MGSSLCFTGIEGVAPLCFGEEVLGRALAGAVATCSAEFVRLDCILGL